jgi:tRNA pseudouridine38-40 synthase
MRNLCLVIAYDGTDFHGWQRQPNAPTVQGSLEDTLARITAAEVKLYGSGRTDAGVHAANQVANFQTGCRIPCDNLRKALNDLLPPTIRIKEVREVPARFHARYDARAKRYRYRILEATICSPFLWRFVEHYPYPLDHRRMAEAARRLEGEHDFTSFAAAGDGDDEDDATGMIGEASGRESPPRSQSAMVRTIFRSRLFWRPKTQLLIYEVRGNGFLHHMVRNIAGVLLAIGEGKREPDWSRQVLEGRDRTLGGITAPANGLCFMAVRYPDEFRIPQPRDAGFSATL